MPLISLECPLGGGKVFQLCLQGAGVVFSLQGSVCICYLLLGCFSRMQLVKWVWQKTGAEIPLELQEKGTPAMRPPGLASPWRLISQKHKKLLRTAGQGHTGTYQYVVRLSADRWTKIKPSDAQDKPAEAADL